MVAGESTNPGTTNGTVNSPMFAGQSLAGESTNWTQEARHGSATALVPRSPPSPAAGLLHGIASPQHSFPLAMTAVLVLALFVRRNPVHLAWRSWWELLSGLGSARASMRLAELCHDSRYTYTKAGSAERDREVRRYLKRAAQAGNVEAALRLGKSHLNRSTRDVPGLLRAERYFRLAAEGGSAEAQFELGKLFQVLGRFKDAYESFELAAKAGHTKAMYSAAEIAEQHLLPTLSAEAILSLYQRAAVAGSGWAAIRLAELLSDGRLAAPDYRQALQWLRSRPCRDRQEARAKISQLQACGFDPDAGEREVIDSRLDLAMQHWQGKGNIRNPRLAWKWASLATETGDPRADYLVGKFLLDAVGVLEDVDEGRKHLEVAARRGLVAAQFELARLLSRPGTTNGEWELAYAWGILAAMQGEPECVALRAELAKKLDRAACARATEHARHLASNIELSPTGRSQPALPRWSPATSPAETTQGSAAELPRLAGDLTLLSGPRLRVS